MKAYGEGGCIDSHFLDLGTSWRWVVSFTAQPLYPRGMGPRAGLGDVEKRKFLTLPGLELRPFGNPARSQSLYRLRSSVSIVSVYTALNSDNSIFRNDREGSSRVSRRVLCSKRRSDCCEVVTYIDALFGSSRWGSEWPYWRSVEHTGLHLLKGAYSRCDVFQRCFRLALEVCLVVRSLDS
jgi:hypothetical protein